MGETISFVRKLGGVLADIFLGEGVPVVPLQTSSFVREEKGRLIITNYFLIEDILSHGGVPMFGGDVLIADHRRTVIVSLTHSLQNSFDIFTVVNSFATDVDGV